MAKRSSTRHLSAKEAEDDESMKQWIPRLPIGLGLVFAGWVGGFLGVVAISYLGFGGGLLMSVFGLDDAIRGKRSWLLGATDILALLVLALLWFELTRQLSNSFHFKF
jgi:hypothetical protein